MPDLLARGRLRGAPVERLPRDHRPGARGSSASSLAALGLEAPDRVDAVGRAAPLRAASRRACPTGMAATRPDACAARRRRRPSARTGRRPRPPRASPAARASRWTTWWCASRQRPRASSSPSCREEGRAVDELVPEVAARLVDGLRFSKTMRWGDGTGLRFSRPGALDRRQGRRAHRPLRAARPAAGRRQPGPPLPGRPGGRSATRRRTTTPALRGGGRGRRPRAPPGPDRRRPRRGRRRGRAAPGATRAASSRRSCSSSSGPASITGRFDARHLELPPRVLVTAMQGHQRYFPLRGRAGGDLLPGVPGGLATATRPTPSVIARGNEDVLDARLQDAEFSFDRDREAGLEALDARLDAIVFHKRLGTMADKRDRLVAGVADLAGAVGADPTTAAAAERGRAPRPRPTRARCWWPSSPSSRATWPPSTRAARASTRPSPGGRGAVPARGAGLAAAVDRGRGAARGRREGRQPRRRLRGRRGADRLEGPLRPAPRRGRAGADRARPRLGRRPVRPCCVRRYERLARAGRRPGRRRGRGPATRSCAFLGDRLAYLLGTRGRGRRGGRRRDGRGPAAARRPRRPGRGRSRRRAATPAFEAAWTAATRLRASRARRPARTCRRAPGDDPGEAALRDGRRGRAPAASRRRGRRATSPRRSTPPRRWRAAVDAFFTDVLVNADDPGVRARRYGLVREAAEVLWRRRRFRAGHRRRRSAVSSTEVGVKRVYDFAEGSRDMRDLLGGKGANVAEMTRLGLPVPKGFTITTETCIALPRRRPRASPRASTPRYHEPPRRARGGRRQAPRRRREPAARLGPQRRQVLDAGDDGHGPQPGPERPQRRGPRRAHRQPALRLRLVPALHPDVRRRRGGGGQGPLRARPLRDEGGPRASSRTST